MLFRKSNPSPDVVYLERAAKKFSDEKAAQEAKFAHLTTDEMREMWKSRLAELKAKAEADRAAIEKPGNPYRITRYEAPARPEGRRTGYYVEAWKVRQVGYGDSGLSLNSIDERWSLCYDLDRVSFEYTGIEWASIITDPFMTLESAEIWLRAWIRPETASVSYDAKGNRI